MINKGKEFRKGIHVHDGRKDRRLSSERHKGISIVLLGKVWLVHIDTQARTASGGGPWPLVNCQNKKSLYQRRLQASVGQLSAAHLRWKVIDDFLREMHALPDWWWRWRRNVSFSLSASLSLFSALTLSSHAHLWSLKLSLKMRVSSNELFSTLKMDN